MAEAYQRRPMASVTEEKRQRRTHAHHCPQFTRAQHFPPILKRLPRIPSNQIIALPARATTNARVYRQAPAGIKSESSCVQAIRVRFSSGEVKVR